MEYSPNYHYIHLIEQINPKNQNTTLASPWKNTSCNLGLAPFRVGTINYECSPQEYTYDNENTYCINDVFETHMRNVLQKLNIAAALRIDGVKTTRGKQESAFHTHTQPQSHRKQKARKPKSRKSQKKTFKWDGETVDPKWLILKEGECDFPPLFDQCKADTPKWNTESAAAQERKREKSQALNYMITESDVPLDTTPLSVWI